MGRLGIAFAALLLAPGCDRVRHDLLDAPDPDIIQPSTISSPEAADALRIGVVSRVRGITAGGEGVWMLGGLLADEWKVSDTFSQRIETDGRNIQDSNAQVQGMYRAIPRVRNSAREAINALNEYKPAPAWGVGQMYMAMGLAELMLAENFCNGIPLSDASTGVPEYGTPRSNAEVFAMAIAHFDTAIGLMLPAGPTADTLANTTRILKARALIDLGNFDAAAALVAGIPTAFKAVIATFSLTSGDNQLWSLNVSQKRWTVGDSFDVTGVIKNALPFASANDPRVKVRGTTLGTSPVGRGFDNSTNFIHMDGMYNRSDAAFIASGVDARLIEAEARLRANDIAGMMAILNALRAAPQALTPVFSSPVMAALPIPATQDAATTLFFREKAFWQFTRGFRLSDLRRQVRQYNRTQDNVFPGGTFFKTSSAYGVDVNFPVTTDELNNPNFTGCADRKA
jgi:hypothetical protein